VKKTAGGGRRCKKRWPGSSTVRVQSQPTFNQPVDGGNAHSLEHGAGGERDPRSERKGKWSAEGIGTGEEDNKKQTRILKRANPQRSKVTSKLRWTIGEDEPGANDTTTSI